MTAHNKTMSEKSAAIFKEWPPGVYRAAGEVVSRDGCRQPPAGQPYPKLPGGQHAGCVVGCGMSYLYPSDPLDDDPDYDEMSMDELITFRNMAEGAAEDPDVPRNMRHKCEANARAMTAEIKARQAAAVEADDSCEGCS